MSDYFIAIVPVDVARDGANDLSRKVIDWLIEKEIILGSMTDCVLGGNKNLGYGPGTKYKDAVEGDQGYLVELVTNGVQISIGRMVFDNGGNGLDKVICPVCSANNIDEDWGDATGAWYENQIGRLTCSQCGRESSITAYAFEPTWAFGEFGLTFWNWPALTDKFLEDLKQFMQKDIKIVYGRL